MALADDDSLIRRTAVDAIRLSDPKKQIALLAPMLYDPVKAVRLEAARSLAEISAKNLNPDLQKIFQAGLSEFKALFSRYPDWWFLYQLQVVGVLLLVSCTP